MVERAIRFLVEAASEAEQALSYYLQQGGEPLGARFLAQIDTALDLIAQHPEIGSQTSHGLRQLRLKRFPFSVVYGVRDEDLIIIAIAHHRRKPGYWSQRST